MLSHAKGSQTLYHDQASGPDGLAVRDPHLARIEAALFASTEPLSARKLATQAGFGEVAEARKQIEKLTAIYERGRSAFIVEEVAGGYQLLTRPDLRPWLDQLFEPSDDLQLSGPTLETLTIVAYRQPINRADIEAIRGVQVGEILRQLMEKGLVKFGGREETLGRPILYITTPKFLRSFGLRNLSELPMAEFLGRPKPTAEAEIPDEVAEAGPDETPPLAEETAEDAESEIERDEQDT